MIGLFAATESGRRAAAELAAFLGADAVVPDGPIRPALHRLWPQLGSAVFFLDAGSAVRLVAPLLRDKQSDPGVLCVDESFAVALAGDSDALTRHVADTLNLTSVVTTGPAGTTLLDDLVEMLDASVDGDLATCAAACAAGETVVLRNPLSFPLPALPDNVVPASEDASWVIVIDDRIAAPRDHTLRIVPRTLVVGVGSAKGVTGSSVAAALAGLEERGKLDLRAVKAFATADAKAGEQGILDAVEEWGFWHGDTATLLTYPAETLASVGVPNPSSVVRNSMGTASVAEAAALHGASAVSGGAPVELAAEKFAQDNVTVAAARILPRGRLALIGLGPGPADLRTPRAEAELRRAAFVVGPVDDLRHLLRPGTEIRSSGAIELAESGAAVALVAHGAAPVLDRPVNAELVTVPGLDQSTVNAGLAD